ncbi:hypothetical protein [Pontivivens insulae]|uniref:hypothetical protein n=1 Tax=Pontivivens insulae TaxID=1639689 RepID=UPI0011B20EBB|nr:hypothetical protein [Pontivivens insulae]
MSLGTFDAGTGQQGSASGVEAEQAAGAAQVSGTALAHRVEGKRLRGASVSRAALCDLCCGESYGNAVCFGAGGGVGVCGEAEGGQYGGLGLQQGNGE